MKAYDWNEPRNEAFFKKLSEPGVNIKLAAKECNITYANARTIKSRYFAKPLVYSKRKPYFAGVLKIGFKPSQPVTPPSENPNLSQPATPNSLKII